MAIAIEDTLEVESVPTNHGTVHALVNVGSQDCTSIGLTTIHEFGESFQIIRRTNLIDAIHFGKRPCSCGDNTQQRCHTQIQ